MSASRVRPWFAVATISILVAATIIGFLTLSDSDKKWSTSGVAQEFKNLVPPPTAKIEAPQSLTTKYGLVSVSASYVEAAAFEVVAQHYNKQFELNGWRKLHAGDGGRLAFCKPNLLARVEDIGPSKPTTTRFQVAISNSSESARLCP